MFFVRVLAEAFEIVGSVGRDIIVAFALAFRGFAERLLALRVEVFMLLEAMVTETFRLWPDHLALHIIRVPPTKVKPVLALLRDWQKTSHYI